MRSVNLFITNLLSIDSMSKTQSKITTGMILAAGFGKRLRPLTRFMPKPLLPFLGKPLLFHIAEKMQTAGISRIAVNLHYKADMIEQAVQLLRQKTEAGLFREHPILGTGGGLANASEFLCQDRAFVLYNGDVFSSIDVNTLLRAHDTHDALVTLALIPGGHDSKIWMKETGAVDAIATQPKSPNSVLQTPFTYTGISVIATEFVRTLPDGYSELAPALTRLIRERPGSVRGYIEPGLFWNDLGTLTRYLDAHKDYLSRNPGFAQPADSLILHADATASVSQQASLKGVVCAGPGSVIEAGAEVEDSIILGNTCVQNGDRLYRSIAGDGFTIQDIPKNILDLEIFNSIPDTKHMKFSPLERQGSDRIFYRIQTPNNSFILMQYILDDGDFTNYLDVNTFLSKCRLGVPKIIQVHQPRKSVLLEDLGDQRLYDAVNGSSKSDIEAMYRQVIEFLIEFQSRGTRQIRECPIAADRQLDYKGLRWETAYFAEMFLDAEAGIDLRRIRVLDSEFDALAAAAAQLPQTLIHRDFQSQNILLKDEKVCIVDVQGARLGPVTYDIASLLYDPYVELPAQLRNNLAEYYAENARQRGLLTESPAEFRHALILCSLQRLMQALGAYGFLARVKNKETFKQFIPAGLRLLRKNLPMYKQASPPLPRLQNLTRLMDAVLKKG